METKKVCHDGLLSPSISTSSLSKHDDDGAAAAPPPLLATDSSVDGTAKTTEPCPPAAARALTKQHPTTPLPPTSTKNTSSGKPPLRASATMSTTKKKQPTPSSRPRLTPSQRALAKAQSFAPARDTQRESRKIGGNVARAAAAKASSPPPRPSRARRDASSEPNKVSRASSHASVASSNAPIPGEANSNSHSKQRRASVGKASQETDASDGLAASQQRLLSPASSPHLQPDSRERASPSPQPNPAPMSSPINQSASKQNAAHASVPPERGPRSAPPATKAKPSSTSSAHPPHSAPPKALPSKPDPYDISIVLSDDDNYSPPRRSTSLTSSVAKLGSGNKASAPARHSLLISREPSSRKPTTDASRTIIPSTPLAKTTGPSSTPAQVPSSPTNHIAAAIHKSRAESKRRPLAESIVVHDSSDELDDLDEDVLKAVPDQYTSSAIPPSFEASLPWPAPPLRASQDPFWSVRVKGRRRSSLASDKEVEDMGGERGAKVDLHKPGQAEPTDAAAYMKSEKALAQSPPTGDILPFDPSSPVESRPNKASTTNTADSPVIIDSSCSDDRDDEVSNGDSDPPVQPRAAEPCNTKNTEAVVIHGSSSQEDSDNGRECLEVTSLFSNQDAPPEPVPVTEGGETALSVPGSGEPDLPELPVLEKASPVQPTAHEGSFSPRADPPPHPEIPKTDPIAESADHESPPSAQPDKRKRQLSDEPDHEEIKRAEKRARRAAKKAENRRLRLEVQAKEKEERDRFEVQKKIWAQEQAHERAKDLAAIVSSPLKPARRGVASTEDYGSDSEAETSGLSDEVVAAVDAVAVFEADDDDDDDDTVVSEESEGRSSWRQLSKRHLSASPQHSQESPVKAPASAAPVKIEYSRTSFDDWAFLEVTLGKSHSPLDVHNQIHLQMMKTGRGDVGSPAENGVDSGDGIAEESVESVQAEDETTRRDAAVRAAQPEEHDGVVPRQKPTLDAQSTPHRPPSPQTDQDEIGESYTSARSVRASAPSPKEVAPAAARSRSKTTGRGARKGQKKRQKTEGLGVGGGQRKHHRVRKRRARSQLFKEHAENRRQRRSLDGQAAK